MNKSNLLKSIIYNFVLFYFLLSSLSKGSAHLNLYDSKNNNPQFAVQLSASTLFTPALMLQGEYQPGFIQRLGILGVGLSVSRYLDIKNINAANIGTGIYMRYQFQYIADQMFVPLLGYSFENIRYSHLHSSTSYKNAWSPIVGISILLNKFEPSQSKDFYDHFKIKRSYFTLEYKNNFLFSTHSSTQKMTVYGGIRLEL